MKIEREKSLISASVERYRAELSQNLNNNLLGDLKTLFDLLSQGTYNSDINGKLFFLTSWVSKINIYLMDYYLIARMLSTHGNTAEAHKKCVVYVGDGHVTTYKKILQEMGFNLVYESTPEATRSACIDISNMVWPYFIVE